MAKAKATKSRKPSLESRVETLEHLVDRILHPVRHGADCPHAGDLLLDPRPNGCTCPPETT